MSTAALPTLPLVPVPAVRCCSDCGEPIYEKQAKFCARCRARYKVRPKKYAPTEQIDQLIRLAYRHYWEFNNRKAIKACAKRIGWPKHVVCRRGRELGLARASENTPWTKCEEEVLCANAHHCNATIVRQLKRAGFVRSETAVHMKLKRDRIKQTLGGYSAWQLAEAFGVDSHKVTAWISRKLLVATRRETERLPQQGGSTWWILHGDVKAFVLRYPDEVDLKKVEKWWFLDLLTDGRICR